MATRVMELYIVPLMKGKSVSKLFLMLSPWNWGCVLDVFRLPFLIVGENEFFARTYQKKKKW